MANTPYRCPQCNEIVELIEHINICKCGAIIKVLK